MYPDRPEKRGPNYLIGSSKLGNSWVFVDGSGVRGDRKRLTFLYSDFPDELALPSSD